MNAAKSPQKSRRKSGAPEARSFVTPLFTAAPSAPQAPKARRENRGPAEWWPKVIFGIILAITYTSQIKVILGNLELL